LICIFTLSAFTRQFENKIQCPYCNESRYQTNHYGQQKKPHYQFACFSLKEHLKIQYKNPNHAEELRYQHNYMSHNGFGNDSKLGDVFDGKCYLDLLKIGYFQDEHDIFLTESIDGYQIFK